MFGDEITTLGETIHDNRGEIRFETFFWHFFSFLLRAHLGDFFQTFLLAPFTFEGTLGGLFSNFSFGTFYF
jgi:hypothetical protein